MAQSSNQNKYDSLLNQFLNNDNTAEEQEENDRMKQWLEEATNRLKSQFQAHRGNDTSVKINSNEMLLSRGYSDELEAAMCISLSSDFSDEEGVVERKIVRKRPCDDSMFDNDGPPVKRFSTDQSFLKDVLDLNMISISPGLTNISINDQQNNGVLRKSSVSTAELITEVESRNSSCIWPIGISQQPDFIEIVVTDAEMNAYWDTIQDLF